MDTWNDFSDLHLNFPDYSQFSHQNDLLTDIEPSFFGSKVHENYHMTIGDPRMMDGCPIDHSDDPDLVRSFYRTVKCYCLPKIPNVTLQTVHRCNLNEIGSVLNSNSVGDGGTAAVVIRDGVNLGLLYIETKRQAEAICDIVTSVLLGQEIRDVSQMLVGREAVQFIKDLFL